MELVGDSTRGLDPRFCTSCGEAFVGASRFCANCGTERAHGGVTSAPLPSGTAAEPTAAPAVAAKVSRPWGLIVPLALASLAVLVLAAWIVSVNGRLGDTKSSLASEQAHVKQLNAKISSLTSDVKRLQSDKSSLTSDNRALQTAMIDCRDAVAKTRRVMIVLASRLMGNASLYDYKAAVKESQRAWQVCQTEAQSNGAF